MPVSWQRIRLPLLERLALAELAEKRAATEEDVLAQLVREAVKAELATDPTARRESQAPHDDCRG